MFILCGMAISVPLFIFAVPLFRHYGKKYPDLVVPYEIDRSKYTEAQLKVLDRINEKYQKNEDLTTEDFYQKLAAADELPHTAQITPAQFQEYFKPFVDSGDEVVCLFISSKMSGTLQSATVAKDILGATNIYLPDTLNVTFALGLLVEEAVKMRDRGLTAPQIVEEIQGLVPRVRLWAFIDDLKYLKMGGRLSASSAWWPASWASAPSSP